MPDHRVERWHRLALPSLFGSIFCDRKPCQETSHSPHEPNGLLHGVLGEEDDADSDTVQDAKTVVGVDEVRGGSKVVPDFNKDLGVACRCKVDLHGHERKECQVDMEDQLSEEQQGEELQCWVDSTENHISSVDHLETLSITLLTVRVLNRTRTEFAVDLYQVEDSSKEHSHSNSMEYQVDQDQGERYLFHDHDFIPFCNLYSSISSKPSDESSKDPDADTVDFIPVNNRSAVSTEPGRKNHIHESDDVDRQEETDSNEVNGVFDTRCYVEVVVDTIGG